MVKRSNSIQAETGIRQTLSTASWLYFRVFSWKYSFHFYFPSTPDSQDTQTPGPQQVGFVAQARQIWPLPGIVFMDTGRDDAFLWRP